MASNGLKMPLAQRGLDRALKSYDHVPSFDRCVDHRGVIQYTFVRVLDVISPMESLQNILPQVHVVQPLALEGIRHALKGRKRRPASERTARCVPSRHADSVSFQWPKAVACFFSERKDLVSLNGGGQSRIGRS